MALKRAEKETMVEALKSDGGEVVGLAESVPARELGEFLACGPRRARAKPDILDQIGLGLRTAYNDVLSQPVPDRFVDLLRRLETSGAQAKKD